MVSPKLAPLIDYLNSLTKPADLPTLRRLLSELDITRADLGRHVHFESDHYARNKVANSAWYELVCVCWKPGQRTPIHDHRSSSCAFLVVEGEATEIVFEQGPDHTLGAEAAPAVRSRGYICASWDADIHEVINDTDRDLITLHIYSPALSHVRIYSRETRQCEVWTPHMAENAGAGAAGM